ncbi:TPA: AraC family transcriptional regulator [Pseudomonas aeruginosa]
MLIEHRPDGLLAAISLDFPDGHHLGRHFHPQAQFLYAARGLMRLATHHGAWVIPPTRAVWIPPRVEHEIFMSGEVHMRTLFIEQPETPTPLSDCCVLAVTPLLREMILRAIHLESQPRLDDFRQRLQGLILSEIANLERMPLYLPMPRDRRLQAICQALLKQPELGLTLDDWGLRVGASSRTLARLFAQELQMSFHEWRQQLRLTEALPRLLAGDSVQVVALDLGYGSTRAFSSMFRRLLGETPRDYLGRLEQLARIRGRED